MPGHVLLRWFDALLQSPAYRPAEAPQEAELHLITDVRRAVDLLAARPDVDPQRIGYFGQQPAFGEGA